MALPDVESLLSLPRETWRALGRRLDAVGLGNEALTPLRELVGSAGNLNQAPLAKWHARRLGAPLGPAMRMFVLLDAVTADEARATLGPELSLEQMLEVGALRQTADGGIVSPFLMKVVEAGTIFRLFSDDLLQGGDAVMGPSTGTTLLAGLARPGARVARGLDVGCGAGTVALVMAPGCDQVVATDVNPRALALTQVNAWMNGVANVEVRRGDLFAPISEQVFDVVASQPPFVSHPPDAPAAAFLYGGERGDELPMRVFRELVPHLAPDGHAFIMVEWPEVEGDPPFQQRIRAAVGPDVDVLVLQKGSSDLDAHCTIYGRVGHGSGDPTYERDVVRHREHLERLGIRALHTGYVVVRRTSNERPGWTAAVQWSDVLGEGAVSREEILALLAKQDQSHPPTTSRATTRDQAEAPKAPSISSLLTMAEHLVLTGNVKEARALFGHVAQQEPTCAGAIRGIARLEIADGQRESAGARLAGLAMLGDREARRLAGDVHWIEGDLAKAFARYAIEPRPRPVAPSRLTPARLDSKVEVRRKGSQKRPFLVWVTCPTFDGTVAGRWFRPQIDRQWDLAANCFAPSARDGLLDHAEHVVLGGDSKLGAVKSVYSLDPSLLEGYHAVLLLDDDVGLRHPDVDRFFWFMARYQLDLAHPSLSDDSSCLLAPMFHQRESVMRFTNVVDTRAPAFSHAGLLACVDSFDQSISGNGLGYVWSHLLEPNRHAVGVIDGVTAHHLRPIDLANGAFHRHLRARGVDAGDELHRVLRQYGCSLVHPRSVGDVDFHGHERHSQT